MIFSSIALLTCISQLYSFVYLLLYMLCCLQSRRTIYVLLRFSREMHWKYFRIFFQKKSQNTKNASQKWKNFACGAAFLPRSTRKDCEAPKIYNSNPDYHFMMTSFQFVFEPVPETYYNTIKTLNDISMKYYERHLQFLGKLRGNFKTLWPTSRSAK